MRQGCVLAIVMAFFALGCGDEETALLGAGRACNSHSDCAEQPVLLECYDVGSGALASKLCTINCTSDSECQAIDPDLSCVSNERKCMYTCPNGSQCPFGGQCVVVASDTDNKCFP